MIRIRFKMFASLLAIVCTLSAFASQERIDSLGSGLVISLWQDEIPNHKMSSETEKYVISDGILKVEQVQNPEMEVFLPSQRSATGQAVIICPGGGYGILAYDWEGRDVAKALNAKGIAGIVLKYRLPSAASSIELHKSPLLDAQRAITLTREHAKSWNIDKHRIGIMGFSAGGHLASTAGTHFNNDTRPDFMVLIYPVISMQDNMTSSQSRSRDALLGKHPDNALKDFYSNEKHVNTNTPPTFIVHASDDDAISVDHSLVMYSALQKKQVPVEMHIYPKGGHGFGLGIGQGYLSSWPDRLFDWMENLPE
ncbi:alpha/beta hydrolase [Alteromonas pelagimontana]|uniref:alpha/beta hydrolase n=1 Tax=Alteromonas pelagimontana TaxID=1858656 RepID=UPI000A61BD86|nr:alpha/beta hydrolase [Alteromonas pelagimontana]